MEEHAKAFSFAIFLTILTCALLWLELTGPVEIHEPPQPGAEASTYCDEVDEWSVCTRFLNSISDINNTGFGCDGQTEELLRQGYHVTFNGYKLKYYPDSPCAKRGNRATGDSLYVCDPVGILCYRSPIWEKILFDFCF